MEQSLFVFGLEYHPLAAEAKGLTDFVGKPLIYRLHCYSLILRVRQEIVSSRLLRRDDLRDGRAYLKQVVDWVFESQTERTEGIARLDRRLQELASEPHGGRNGVDVLLLKLLEELLYQKIS